VNWREVIARIFRGIGEFLRRLVSAIRHVRTGGASTQRRAQKRASRPGMCSACRQPIPQSDDWRDHLEEAHPEWARD
jgi:hypothetical protein